MPKFNSNIKRHKYNNTVTDMTQIKFGYLQNATPTIDKYRGDDYTSGDATGFDDIGMTTEATNPGLMSDTQNDSMADNTARKQRGYTNVSHMTSEFANSRIADTQRE